MNSRQRVHCALNHQEPDRVPIDFGQDYHNGIHEMAYGRLLDFLEMNDGSPVQVYDYMQRLAIVDSRVLERFHVDTRDLMINPNKHFPFVAEADGSFEDEWRVYRKRCGYYCETVRSPLAGMDKAQIARHPFPDPTEKSRFEGFRQQAQRLWAGTDYALMAGQAATLFYLSAELRGFKQFMSDLALSPDLIEVLVDKVLEWMLAFTGCYLDAIGEYVEGWWMGDDWGMQTGPIVSPTTFRKLFKPRYQKLLDMVRSKTRAKVCLHTCGATFWILQDLAEVGIDVVILCSRLARGNEDPERIKRDFGDRLSFYSNIANATVLPQAPGGGGGGGPSQDSRLGAGGRIHLLGRTQHSGRRAAGEHRKCVRHGLRIWKLSPCMRACALVHSSVGHPLTRLFFLPPILLFPCQARRR